MPNLQYSQHNIPKWSRILVLETFVSQISSGQFNVSSISIDCELLLNGALKEGLLPFNRKLLADIENTKQELENFNQLSNTDQARSKYAWTLFVSKKVKEYEISQRLIYTAIKRLMTQGNSEIEQFFQDMKVRFIIIIVLIIILSILFLFLVWRNRFASVKFQIFDVNKFVLLIPFAIIRDSQAIRVYMKKHMKLKNVTFA
eukprot:TRINITY_DN8321_c0_g1_i4.p1 TRINITY_DN8321_c0_g1~~TRINITY_DN8321_c0_g1_i4.p1  ORF type:complete len:201 (+),score=30.52 TRINITY_DN8321_c0_g1_i4:144-746(+)